MSSQRLITSMITLIEWLKLLGNMEMENWKLIVRYEGTYARCKRHELIGHEELGTVARLG